MKWTKVAALFLCLLLLLCIFIYAQPLIQPVLRRNPKEGILGAFLRASITPHQQTPFEQAFPVIVLAIMLVMLSVISYDMKHRTRRTHGSARYAVRRETHKYRAPRRLSLFRPSRALGLFTGGRGEYRLRLGWYHGREISLSAQHQYQHVLLTAPTGAGKSARVFIPNLLRETGQRSLFVGDLKNELYRVTAGWLAQSMQIWLFAPQIPASQSYNPLAHIRSVEDAQDFAEAWVTNTGTSRDEFWPNNAKLLITAMTLHLLASERAPSLARLADVLTTSSFEEIQEILSKTRSQDARRLARQFLLNMAKNERLVGSILTDIGNRFQLLASSQTRKVTATNDIDFREMIETPTAFFLTIPRSEAKRYRPLLAVLMLQMFKEWEQRGTNGVGCYLDEFTNLGHIPGYAEFISTARALRVSLLMAIQNFSQLDERYGREDAETIKANAVTHLLLPGAGLQETRYYSERIGDTTVQTTTINRSGSSWAGSVTSSEGETRRRLMTADELRTMAADTMLMVEATAAPLLLKTKLYFQERKLAERANIPYQVTRIRMEPTPPPAPPGAPRGLPPGGQPPAPPIVVEADQADDADAFFQQE